MVKKSQLTSPAPTHTHWLPVMYNFYHMFIKLWIVRWYSPNQRIPGFLCFSWPTSPSRLCPIIDSYLIQGGYVFIAFHSLSLCLLAECDKTTELILLELGLRCNHRKIQIHSVSTHHYADGGVGEVHESKTNVGVNRGKQCCSQIQYNLSNWLPII